MSTRRQVTDQVLELSSKLTTVSTVLLFCLGQKMIGQCFPTPLAAKLVFCAVYVDIERDRQKKEIACNDKTRYHKIH